MDINEAIEVLRQYASPTAEVWRLDYDALEILLADHARLQQRAAESTVRELQETLREFNTALGFGGYEQFGMHGDFFILWRELSPDRRSMKERLVADSTPAGFIAQVKAKTAELLAARKKP